MKLSKSTHFRIRSSPGRTVLSILMTAVMLLCVFTPVAFSPATVSAAPGFQFTIQPQGGEIPPDQKYITVTWETNFTPVKLQKVNEAGYVVNFPDPTIISIIWYEGNNDRLRAFYGDGSKDYIDSDPFTVTKKLGFAVQPQGGEIPEDKDYITVTWETNFTPVKLQKINESGTVVNFPDPTITSSIWYEGKNNRLRAFYGEGSKDYVDSDPFSVNRKPAFTVQPQGGGIIAGKTSIDVTWGTNFTPSKLVIGVNGGIYAVLSKPTVTQMKLGLGENYFVRAYYGEGDNDYIDSELFSIIELVPTFTVQPQGGEIPFGECYCVTWATNFTPIKLQEVNKYGNSFSMFADPTKTYEYYYSSYDNISIRAYYGEGDNDYVDSEPFTITMADSPAFTEQPQGGTIQNGEYVFRVIWKTNFTPVKLEELDENGEVYSVFLDPTVQSFSFTECSDKRLRAYYGTEDSDYIDSEPFSITKLGPCFTVQPQGGEIPLFEDYFEVTWETSFIPLKLEKIDEYRNVISIFSNPTQTNEYYFSLYDNIRIRAYYGEGENDYIDSDCFSITYAGNSIFFKANGGSGQISIADSNNSVKIDSPFYVLPENEFTPPEGMYFKAWSIDNIEYQPGDNIQLSKKTIVYAVWRIDSELTVTAELVPGEIQLGNSAVITVSAEGGTAPYTYTYRTRKSGVSTWTYLGETNVTNNTYSYTPTETGTYTVQVLVKDADKTVVSKGFTLNVTDAVLTNNSTISATSTKTGKAVILTAKAAGGKAPYTYTYRTKKSDASVWTYLGETNVTTNTYSYTPTEEGTYTVQIIVKDADKTVVTKGFTLNVKEATDALINNSTISTTNTITGRAVTITAKAVGGKAFYTYTYRIKKSDASVWTYLGATNVTTDTYNYTPTTAGTYTIQVLVKDADKTVVTKGFTLKVTEAPVALTNNSITSATSTETGKAVTLTAKATGGKAPYTYTYRCKKSDASKWTYLGATNVTTTTYSYTPTAAGTYTIQVLVKDADKTVVTKGFTLKVTEAPVALTNNSAISATSTETGKVVTLTAKAVGGKAPYTYTYRCKKNDASKWTYLGATNVTTNTYSYTPTVSGTYTVQVLVKDADKTVVTKGFTLNVSDAVLTNNSTISATSTETGKAVTLTAKAVGGKAPYTYTYRCKKSDASAWTYLGSTNVTTTTYSYKPTEAGTYTIQILVKDADKTVVTKGFTLKVIESSAILANTSTISATSVKAGSAVTLTAKATGGKAPYTYTYRCKKTDTSTWKYLATNTNTAALSYKPASAGTYDIQVLVKDADGKTVAKGFKLSVT